MGNYNIKRFSNPRRYFVIYYDTKKLYINNSTFRSLNGAKNFICGLKFIGSDLIVFDSETEEIIA